MKTIYSENKKYRIVMERVKDNYIILRRRGLDSFYCKETYTLQKKNELGGWTDKAVTNNIAGITSWIKYFPDK